MATPIDIRKLTEAIFSTPERYNFSNVWEELAEFILPNQAGNFRNQTATQTDLQTANPHNIRGAKRTRRLYDNTAVKSNQDLSSAIFAAVYSSSSRLANLKYRSAALNENKAALQWLENVEDELHTAFSDSNLMIELPRILRQYSALGSTALLHEVDLTGQFKFKSLHMNNVAWAENSKGVVDTVVRKFNMTYQQMFDRWGDNVPDDVIKGLLKGKTLDEKCIVHTIIPNPQFADNGQMIKEPEDRPYHHYYMVEGGDKFLETGGFYEFPIYALRWDMYPGETYGRGVGHIAIPNIRSLNVTRRLVLEGLALAVRPPILTTRRGALGSLDLRAGGQSVVNRIDDVKEFNTGARFEVASLETEELRNSIKEAFFLDKLILPPRTETGEMTAFEVSIRTEQIQRVLGSTFGRLNKELLEPMILRAFRSLLRLGKLGTPPDEVVADGLNIDIVFNNQLSRSQNIEEVNTTNAWVQQVGALAQLDPTVINLLDVHAIARNTARESGVPELAVRTKEATAEITEAQAQQAQQQQMLEAGGQVAEIASKMPEE